MGNPVILDEDLELPELGPPKNSSGRYQILAISGGGYRGLYSAFLLEALEEKAGRPLAQCFDLVAGTSIGGIIAAAISLEIPASTIKKAIKTHGPAIFDQTIRVAGYSTGIKTKAPQKYRALYQQSDLKKAIEEIFGDDVNKPLSEVPVRLLIPAVSQTSAEPVLYMSDDTNQKGTILDAMLSTSAAPTYFPPYEKGRVNYVDGGLIANSPDMLAYGEALKKGIDTNNIHILSIGTAATTVADRPRDLGNPGEAQWFMANDLFLLVLEAQEKLTHYQCESLLGKRYLRLDSIPNENEAKVIALDKADDDAKSALRHMAEIRIKKAFDGIEKQSLALFLQHTTQ